ncbi:LutB/LldF family L-lactate oxidation iron-sulfur protein [Desulfobacterota bacterium AH_259_B03_O07]|nr:LutB/LldF family L-lactate oxidation iron-sulfur protein [Desulfobacterota bacterium AH_259_B03_O07]
MEVDKYDFKKDSEKALNDDHLQKALILTTDLFRERRKSAIENVDNWEHLRSRAREVKKETISKLDGYLESLEENVVKAGGKVHWASDADEAARIILDIALKAKVKTVVKSKSMATEEIELNHVLKNSGIEAIETDLGEYIIQLADETPSHILVPAIHKTKDDISKLFSEKLDVPYYSQPEQITRVAREKLREKFLGADMGVSGVNFAVAETGTIVIVENEGNARMTTTLPGIHVALMGIEKVIPRFEDLGLFLSILARSATGQKMSSYVSFITGPKRKDDKDGPEEFHLVLLDNGRSSILASEETRESLYCIRCGACLNICPVYRKVGGHSYGWVYSGPIGAIINPQLLGIDKAPDLPFASSLCGACKDVCPVKIDFPHVLLELRRRVVDNNNRKKRVGGNLIQRLGIKFWRFSMQSQMIYSIMLSIAYYAQLLFVSGNQNRIRFLPYPFSLWTRHKDFPVFAKTPFRKWWKHIKHE